MKAAGFIDGAKGELIGRKDLTEGCAYGENCSDRDTGFWYID